MTPSLKRMLIRALTELIALETDSARVHYAIYRRVTKTYEFSDAIWKKSHASSFNKVKRARRALELLRQTKPANAPTSKRPETT